MHKEDILEFTIPNWALPSLIYGDDSGLSEEDVEKLDKFVNRIVEKYGNANFMLPDEDKIDLGFEPYNDIDNLGSDCSLLYLRPTKDEEGGDVDDRDEDDDKIEQLADEYDIPEEVVREYLDYMGIEPSDADSLNYYGRFSRESDFAEQLVDEGVITDLGRYLYMTATDMRLLAGEEADNRVDDMDDEDVMREVDGDYSFEEIDAAREDLKSQYYDEIHDQLERDAVQYFVQNFGYDEQDLINNSAFSVDYDKLGEDLEYDYTYINHDGETFVFSNYSRGGYMAKGGAFDKNWVIEFHKNKGESLKVIRVKAKTKSEAIDKGFMELSNRGEDSDDYSVAYAHISKYADGGEIYAKGGKVLKLTTSEKDKLRLIFRNIEKLERASYLLDEYDEEQKDIDNDINYYYDKYYNLKSELIKKYGRSQALEEAINKIIIDYGSTYAEGGMMAKGGYVQRIKDKLEIANKLISDGKTMIDIDEGKEVKYMPLVLKGERNDLIIKIKVKENGRWVNYHNYRITDWDEGYGEETRLEAVNRIIKELKTSKVELLADGGETYAYGGFINKNELTKIEQESYRKAVMKGISIIGSLDGITFNTHNENLANNLAKSFSDIGYDTKVVIIGRGETYVVWVKKIYADGGMMAKGGATEHGLMEGDTIMEVKDNLILIQTPSREYFVLDIEKGERKPTRVTDWIKMADGGGTSFSGKVKSISKSLLKRKKVSPSVQKDYGKTYSKSEAIDSAKRIVGAMRKKETSKKKS